MTFLEARNQFPLTDAMGLKLFNDIFDPNSENVLNPDLYYSDR